MGTKKGQRRKTARRAYYRPGQRPRSKKPRRAAKRSAERTRKARRKNWLNTGSLPLSDFKWGFGKDASKARKAARGEARKLRRKK